MSPPYPELPDVEPFHGLSLERYALLSFMQHWSEEMWAAGWLQDLPYVLATVGRDRPGGVAGVSPTGSRDGATGHAGGDVLPGSS